MIMTQEDKELLLKDLCARLPYNVKCHVPTYNCAMTLTGKRLNYFCFHKDEWGIDYSHEIETVLDPLNDQNNDYVVKPYLRSMSSMTDEEEEKYDRLNVYEIGLFPHTEEAFDWLNAHHFDFRGLIEKGLALEAPKEMYK